MISFIRVNTHGNPCLKLLYLKFTLMWSIYFVCFFRKFQNHPQLIKRYLLFPTFKWPFLFAYCWIFNFQTSFVASNQHFLWFSSSNEHFQAYLRAVLFLMVCMIIILIIRHSVEMNWNVCNFYFIWGFLYYTSPSLYFIFIEVPYRFFIKPYQYFGYFLF